MLKQLSCKSALMIIMLCLHIVQVNPLHVNCDTGLEKAQNSAPPLVITSENLVADNKKSTAIFTGNVKAVRGEMELLADRMVVVYGEDRRTIMSVTATGNTRLVSGDRKINSHRADYYTENERIIFSGNPEATEDKNRITGTKMTYFINDERYIVENSRVYIIKEE